MPTYEYHCVSCNYEFEQEGRITDPPVSVCPNSDCPSPELLIRQVDGKNVAVSGPVRLISRKGGSGQDRGFIAHLWDNDR